MIDNFTRDISFFQSLSESNSDIIYNDFDNEINNFVNYLNKKIVTSINNIATKSYNGILNNFNYIVKNVGDGNVIFDSLKDVNYKNNGIYLIKINTIDPFSLLFVNSLSEIITYNIKKDIKDIGGVFNEYYNYSDGIKITGKYFYDNSILSNNIEKNSITLNHLDDSGKKYLVDNIKITNSNIVDKSLSLNNFSRKSITYDKLHPDIKNAREINNLSYINNSINNIQIKNNSFNVSLLNIGNGIFDKAVIPYDIIISKPTAEYPETIDTYQLAIYSISNAYELKTYQQPLPDQLYLNPLFVEYENLYNENYNLYIQHAAIRDNLYNSSVVNGVNAFSWSKSNPTHGFKWFFDNVLKKSSTTTDNIKIINNLNKNLPLYLEEIKKADYYQDRLNYYANLVNTTPKNIYRPIPPQIYQRLEPVVGKKLFKIKQLQSCIKSRHLKDNSFYFNFLDKNTYTNISDKKFINKYSLSEDLRVKLGLNIE